MADSKKTPVYDESSIQVLEGLEAVRTLLLGRQAGSFSFHERFCRTAARIAIPQK